MLNDIARYGGDVSVLKALTSGDRLAVELKGINKRQYLVFHGLVLVMGEHTLKSSDLQSGMDRRRYRIHFEKRAQNPRILLEIVNGELIGEWVGELSGLANLLLRMSEEECVKILSKPHEVNSEEFRLEQLAEQNSIAGFLLAKCENSPCSVSYMGNALSNDGLYPLYLVYCDEQKIMALTLPPFVS